VFLPTFRRANLLPRAVESLLKQTHTNWVCELHNDDPADPFPAELVSRLSDSRIQLVQHERNLGTVATFNLFYQPLPEAFYSILEDDNWWEPEFLEKMLDAMTAFPNATLAWCNQHIWQEMTDGSWKDTDSHVNPQAQSDSPPRLIRWGHLRQVMGGLQANGAMLIRSRPGISYTTPDIPLAGIESYRDRMFPYPLVYVPQPLANFAQTLQTARGCASAAWGAFQVSLAVTFLRNGSFNVPQLGEVWTHFKNQRPPMTNELFATAFICGEARPLLRFASFADWLRFLLNTARHPLSFFHKLRVRTEHPLWWNELNRLTSSRFAEASRNPSSPFPTDL
jgi:glycosyltransferase involved in cell wall biosynthesis